MCLRPSVGRQHESPTNSQGHSRASSSTALLSLVSSSRLSVSESRSRGTPARGNALLQLCKPVLDENKPCGRRGVAVRVARLEHQKSLTIRRYVIIPAYSEAEKVRGVKQLGWSRGRKG